MLHFHFCLQGFRKVDPDQWEFANEEFIRGQRHLLKNIHRRKPIHSHSGPGNAAPFTDSEREEFEKEIEKLKQEKVSLQTEVERYKEENRGYERELRSLGQTLQAINHRQRQLVLNLSHFLQSPPHGFDQSESPSKKRRLLALDYFKDESDVLSESNGTTMMMMIKDDSSPSSLPLVDLTQVERLDSSLTFWERFLHGTTREESPSSPVDSDLNIPPCTPECRSSPELSLPLSSVHIDAESNHEPSVDTNVRPVKDQEPKTGFRSVPANDVFWQQFLTEAPASEQRELYEKESGRFSDEHKPWWIGDGLGQHMGHLTQVERI